MNRWDLTALAINGIIGAGIFGLPSSVAAILGAASPIAFALCAVVVYVIVLCFGEVARQFTETGGPYLYAREAFGSFIGFETGWATWIARTSAFGANSNVLISYLGFFAPQVTTGIARVAVLLAVTASLAIINVRGVRASARFGDAFAIAKIAGLVVFVAAGLFFVDWKVFSGTQLTAGSDWTRAILLVTYAFTGFESAVIPAAEAKNPRSDIAGALILGLAGSAIVYFGVQVVAVGTVPALAASSRPLADAAREFLGPAAGAAVSVLACISILGNLSNIALVCPRLTYAFAERREFPAWFGRLHPRFKTPEASILFFAVIAAILAISGTFVWLAMVSVAARLSIYLATCLALPFLRKRTAAIPLLKALLGSPLAILGVALCAWLAFQTSSHDLLAFGIAAAFGVLLYLARPRKVELH